MDVVSRLLQSSDTISPDYSLESTLLSLLLAFVLGQTIAWVYSLTHTGLSYSRTFTQSLVLLTMVVSLVMYVIGNSIVTAFGLIGALAIIRFRNVLKDTRDTSYVFFALVLGMAVGSQRYQTALLGTAVLLLAALHLQATRFGTRGRFDGHLTLSLPAAEEARAAVLEVLRRFCRGTREVSARHGPSGLAERVFQVRLRNRRRSDELMSELRAIEGTGDVSLVLRDELAEI